MGEFWKITKKAFKDGVVLYFEPLVWIYKWLFKKPS